MNRQIIFKKHLFTLFLALVSFIVFIFPNTFLKTEFFKNSTFSKNLNAKKVIDTMISEHLSDVQHNLTASKNISKDITFSIQNTKVNFSSPVYTYKNRLYFNLKDFLDKIYPNVELSSDKDNISFNIDNDQITINNSDKNFKINNNNLTKLKGESLTSKDTTYISLNDLTEILNLKTVWDSKSKKISIYKSKSKSKLTKQGGQAKDSTKPAFIRLEDVACGTVFYSDENMEKLRAVGDVFNESSSRFHVTWVPRYKYPEKNIDIDLANEVNFMNSEFLYTLDYLSYRGGIIGLHGYTHQFDDKESIVSYEFDKSLNLSEEEQTTKVEAAIKSSIDLNIPLSFFETPHYQSSEQFQKLISHYFKYLYEPCLGVWNEKIYKSRAHNNSYFLPAPLSYVKDKDISPIVKGFENKNLDLVKSFFYHPSKEFDYINLKRDSSGYPSYEYNDSSLLKGLLKSIKSNGYSLKSIYDIDDLKTTNKEIFLDKKLIN